MEYILDYKKSAIIAVVTAIAYRTYSKIPVPKNFEAPHTYKCRHLIIRMIMLMVRVAKIFDKRAEAIIFREYVNKLVPGIQSSKVKTVDRQINGVNCRVYNPISLSDTKEAPIIIYYHGGGFYFGGLNVFDDYCNKLCLKLNAVVISVDYRMAPEHPFPIPTNDCFAVTKYVLESNDEFGDTNKTILAGDSAGGNIVMVMTQRLAKEKIKQPKMQVLIYPWTQMFNNQLPSHIGHKAIFQVGHPIVWYLGITDNKLAPMVTYNNHTLLIEDQEYKDKLKSYTDIKLIPEEYKVDKKYYETYGHIDEKFPTKPRAEKKHLIENNEINNKLLKIFSAEFSPGLADPEDLKGLPKAYFILVEADPLKDEGLIYSERLRNAGVTVDVKMYENAYHGCAGMVGKKKGFQVSRDMLDDLVTHIKNNF